MDLFRYVASLFGARFVVLIDRDGERNIRRIKFCGGRPFAARFGFGIANVWLLDGGGVVGACYVVSWVPYYPFAPRQWPSHSEAA